MASSFPVPDYPVTVYADLQHRKQIAVGAGEVSVDGKLIDGAVVVDRAVLISGNGQVTVSDVEPEPKKAPAKKKTAAKPKAKATHKKVPTKKAPAKKGKRK